MCEAPDVSRGGVRRSPSPGILSDARVLLARIVIAIVLSATAAAAQNIGAVPHPVTNNAVAAGRIGQAWWIFSALGVDSTKRWSGITRRAHGWNSETKEWFALADVPGADGRLAATAQVVRGRLYLIGGYTVDSAGGEKSLASVDVYTASTGKWSAGAAIPIPVDDAVSGVYRDSLIYLVSGWHDTDNVQDVQVYDVVRDRWTAATPTPGRGVFGHTGEMAGRTIVYVDGAAKQLSGAPYALVPQVWLGRIDPSQPTRIDWQRGPAHPGPALYRAAAAACGRSVVIAGGTASPYNYNGIGYDTRPSEPLSSVILFDTDRGTWRSLAPLPVATMDQRALARRGHTGWIVGGMRAGQRVSADIVAITPLPCEP